MYAYKPYDGNNVDVLHGDMKVPTIFQKFTQMLRMQSFENGKNAISPTVLCPMDQQSCVYPKKSVL